MDLLDQILQEMKAEGIRGSLARRERHEISDEERAAWREKANKRLAIKREATLKLLYTAKELLSKLNPRIPCEFCEGEEDHAKDCTWLLFKKEVLSYENKYGKNKLGRR